MKILIISEKPSVTKNIIKAISNIAAVKNDGYFEDDKFIYTNALGHLISMKNPQEINEKYSKWNLENLPIEIDLLDYIDNYKVVDDKLKHFNMLKKLMVRQDVASIINACDPDREGEFIFRLIYEYSKSKLPFQKVILKDMTPNGLKSAFSDLKEGKEYDLLRDSAFTRSWADFYVGINLTQAISIKKGELNSVGRVQTPTLKLVVDRTLANKNHTKSYKYLIDGIILNEFNFTLKDKEFQSNEEGLKYLEKLPSEVNVLITSKEVTCKPPLIPDLLYVQKIANKNFSYTAENTLKIVQSLYEKHKMVTYPRTDCRYVTEETTIKLNSIINRFASFESFKYVDKDKINKQVIGDVSAHEALTPTGTINENLSTEERNVFEIILNIFLANFTSEYRYIDNSFEFKTKDGDFKYSNKELLTTGYLNIYNDKNHKYIDNEANLTEGKYKPNYQVREVESTPPKLFTEGTLLSKMENITKDISDDDDKELLKSIGGIGTPATRGTIIEILKKREFVVLKGKSIISTSKGEDLIKTLNELDLNISNVQFTVDMENSIKDIVDGKSTPSEFQNKTKKYMLEELGKINTLKDVAKINTNKVLGKCPKCGGNIISNLKSKTYYCSNYKDKECKFIIWKKIAKKNLTDKIIIDLLRKRKTSKIKGFKSKIGKSFSAELVLKEDLTIGFNF